MICAISLVAMLLDCIHGDSSMKAAIGPHFYPLGRHFDVARQVICVEISTVCRKGVDRFAQEITKIESRHS
jgi:hypothetical protein